MTSPQPGPSPPNEAQKVDLILKHLGLEYVEVTPPCPLSREVQKMARVPGRKIPAIKLHRENGDQGHQHNNPRSSRISSVPCCSARGRI